MTFQLGKILPPEGGWIDVNAGSAYEWSEPRADGNPFEQFYDVLPREPACRSDLAK